MAIVDDRITQVQERTIISFFKKNSLRIAVVLLFFVILAQFFLTSFSPGNSNLGLLGPNVVEQCDGESFFSANGTCVSVQEIVTRAASAARPGSGGGNTTPNPIPFRFTLLSDSPNNYTGFSNYLVRVNNDENGVEFFDGNNFWLSEGDINTLIAQQAWLLNGSNSPPTANWDMGLQRLRFNGGGAIPAEIYSTGVNLKIDSGSGRVDFDSSNVQLKNLGVLDTVPSNLYGVYNSGNRPTLTHGIYNPITFTGGQSVVYGTYNDLVFESTNTNPFVFANRGRVLLHKNPSTASHLTGLLGEAGADPLQVLTQGVHTWQGVEGEIESTSVTHSGGTVNAASVRGLKCPTPYSGVASWECWAGHFDGNVTSTADLNGLRLCVDGDCINDWDDVNATSGVSETDGNNSVWVTLTTTQDVLGPKTFKANQEIDQDTNLFIDQRGLIRLQGPKSFPGPKDTARLTWEIGTARIVDMYYTVSGGAEGNIFHIDTADNISLSANSGNGTIELDGDVAFNDDIAVQFGTFDTSNRKFELVLESGTNTMNFKPLVHGLSDLIDSVVFNSAGRDVDFKIRGDTDQNLFIVNAGTDRVGIGESNPNEKLEVSGQVRAQSFDVNGTDGLTQTIFVRLADNSGSCTIDVNGGIITSTTC